MIAGRVHGIVQGRGAAGPLLQNRVAKIAGISREILDDLRPIVERHQKSLIFSATQCVKQEIDGGVLLEFQAFPNAVGGVQHHADAQRKVGRLAERSNFLLRAVVEHFEIFLIQIGDQLFVLGHHAEKHFHEVHVANDRALAVHLRGSLRRRWWLRLLRPHSGDSRDETQDDDPNNRFFHDCHT